MLTRWSSQPITSQLRENRPIRSRVQSINLKTGLSTNAASSVIFYLSTEITYRNNKSIEAQFSYQNLIDLLKRLLKYASEVSGQDCPDRIRLFGFSVTARRNKFINSFNFCRQFRTSILSQSIELDMCPVGVAVCRDDIVYDMVVVVVYVFRIMVVLLES